MRRCTPARRSTPRRWPRRRQVIAGPFTLDPSYRHLFQADNHTSPEIIFPIVQDGMRTQTFGGTTFLVHAVVRRLHGPRRLGRRRLLVRPAPQAGGVQSVGPRATSDGVVLLDRRPDGRRHQHQQFQQRHRGAQVHQQDQHRGQRLRPRPHPDTDFPLFRLADAYLIYAEAHAAWRRRRSGAGAGLRERPPAARLRQHQRQHRGCRAHAGFPPRRARARAAVGGPPPDRPGPLWPVHRRRLHLAVEGRGAGWHGHANRSGTCIRCPRPSSPPTRT